MPHAHDTPHSFAALDHLGLYTDFYELTMAQGYVLSGRATQRATFDYFFRSLPFGGGHVIFAGLCDLISAISALRFTPRDLDFLASKGLRSEFLDFLSSFRFSGTIRAVREGEVVFPLTPLLRVDGTIAETQLIEALLLNILNFESLVATKASRIAQATAGRPFFEFGLRRAQGMGAAQATRAAVIGGAAGTSNVLAALESDLVLGGTQAHSWIQHFGDELTAFRAYAELYPDTCVLLVDTYNTLSSGVPNAITVARELEARGHRLLGVRLDSGDLAYLSKKTRAQLDHAGLGYVKIYATNQLDEHLIKSLLDQDAPIDVFGVGTRLVTGTPDSALDGVYKLAASRGEPCLKISDNFTKVNFPGTKKVVRFIDDDGMFYGDAIALDHETDIERIYHPFFPAQHSDVAGFASEDLLRDVVVGGELVGALESPDECAEYAASRLAKLPAEHRRFANPHTYKVGATETLLTLRSTLYDELVARTSRTREIGPAS
ncbi:MAG: nicotinate phosphoribosyltransferase [Myxococcota bacterium]